MNSGKAVGCSKNWWLLNRCWRGRQQPSAQKEMESSQKQWRGYKYLYISIINLLNLHQNHGHRWWYIYIYIWTTWVLGILLQKKKEHQFQPAKNKRTTEEIKFIIPSTITTYSNDEIFSTTTRIIGALSQQGRASANGFNLWHFYQSWSFFMLDSFPWPQYARNMHVSKTQGEKATNNQGKLKGTFLNHMVTPVV